MPIYDALPANLFRFYGIVPIATSMAGLWLFYNTPATYVFGLDAVKHWGGLAYFTLVTVMTGRYTSNLSKQVNRIFLLSGGSIVRFQFNNGANVDVPISSIQQKTFDDATT